MHSSSANAYRSGEVWRVLAGVNDPELDEPVTELGFVERADIADDGLIELDFRLPTYWCSPNFAFLMLDDIRKALESLPWRPRFRITLHDHLFADEVNKGISEGRPFESIFDSLGPRGDLTALRETFRKKAFQKRQEAAILALRGAGWLDEEILRLDCRTLDELTIGSELAAPLVRYREALQARFSAVSKDSFAFVFWDGSAIVAADLLKYLAKLRAVRINMEFNGALCRGLKQVRYWKKELASQIWTV